MWLWFLVFVIWKYVDMTCKEAHAWHCGCEGRAVVDGRTSPRTYRLQTATLILNNCAQIWDKQAQILH